MYAKSLILSFLFSLTVSVVDPGPLLPSCIAESQKVETARFILLASENSHTGQRNVNKSKKFDGIARLKYIISQVLETSTKTHEELTRIFRYSPTRKIILKILSLQEFKKETQAPAWTSAMYLNGEIFVPINQSTLDLEELKTAVRHECVHAFTDSITNSKIPAWIDEGLAQIIEGPPNPLLGHALRKWISNNDAMPLDKLMNGFTALNHVHVPVAYAQSMFTTRTLINRYGMQAINNYLNLIKTTEPHAAFTSAFGLTQDDFEEELNIQIFRWAKSESKNPL